jgi:transcriptional regulator with XRE-family HTH domain/phage-related protein
MHTVDTRVIERRDTTSKLCFSPHDVRFEVQFFRESDGTKPVATFLRSLNSDAVLAGNTKAAIKAFQDDLLHREPVAKSLSDGLYEVRIQGKDAVRVVFFYASKCRVVVVHAFQKKTQKTPLQALRSHSSESCNLSSRSTRVSIMKTDFDLELDEIFGDDSDEQAEAEAAIAIGIAVQLHALRERRGMSQAQVAERSGRSQQAISKIENPTHAGHNLATLQKVVEALGAVIDVTIVPIEDLDSYRDLYPPKPTLENINERLAAAQPVPEAKVSPLPQQPARPRRRQAG